MKKIFFYAIVFIPTCIFSQVYSPLYKAPYNLSNDSNQNLTNYQVLVVLNTVSPIAAGHMRADGGDIRFSADSCSPVSFYDHWIEGPLNSNATKVWVKIPALLANSTTNFVLWYGDSTAISQSNFNSTFPNAFLSNGNDTAMSGSYYFDWFEVNTGDTITSENNTPLIIRSRVIKMNGTIDGNGKGYTSPISIANGNGPGGGGMSNTAGAGGGSYTGLGGVGGMDVGDTPGSGGAVYGASNDQTCLMGSSGGTTDNAIGGNGGGAIELNAEWIEVNGNILSNGNVGIGSIGRCGGGGSGGTILIIGENIDFGTSNLLSAKGGNGGNGSSAANDGGGGGSGGRIKIFHGQNLINSANFSLFGGAGGEYGSLSFGTDGANGSYFDTTSTLPLVHFMVSGTETDLVAQIVGLDSLYCLNKDSILLMALPPGGTFTGAGIAANYFYPLTAGVGLHAISYLYNDPNGCGTLYDTTWVRVLNIPTFPTASNNSPICAGDALSLSSSDSLATHFWQGPGGFTSNSQSPIISNTGGHNSGSYSVTITNASGCSSTVITNVVVNPMPDVTVTNNGPICVDQALSFEVSGGSAFSWNGPNGFSSGLQSPTLSHTQFASQGTYTVTISNSDGCEITVTTEVQVNGCYEGIENAAAEIVLVYPNPTYNDLWIDLRDIHTNGTITVDVFDIYGKKIISRFVSGFTNNRFKIELEELANGTYIISIADDTLHKSFKIVKQ